jgi:hypothetical protein
MRNEGETVSSVLPGRRRVGQLEPSLGHVGAIPSASAEVQRVQFCPAQPTAGFFDVKADVGELRIVRVGSVGRESLGATPSPETIRFDTRHDGRLD